MEVMEAIKGRRSIRWYKDTSVDDKTLELVLEAARWAPSWANTQCWRFIVVKDNNLKAELAGTLSTVNPAANAVKVAPVVIVACAELQKSGYGLRGPATDKGDYWYMYDVGLAMQNLTLGAYALGLGTVHIGAVDFKKAASILKLPEGFCVVAMTPLGYPDHQRQPTPRKELTEIVFYDSFGTKASVTESR